MYSTKVLKTYILREKGWFLCAVQCSCSLNQYYEITVCVGTPCKYPVVNDSQCSATTNGFFRNTVEITTFCLHFVVHNYSILGTTTKYNLPPIFRYIQINTSKNRKCTLIPYLLGLRILYSDRSLMPCSKIDSKFLNGCKILLQLNVFHDVFVFDLYFKGNVERNMVWLAAKIKRITRNSDKYGNNVVAATIS